MAAMDAPYPPIHSSSLSTFVGGLFIDPILPSSFLNSLSSSFTSPSNSASTIFTPNFADSCHTFEDSRVCLQRRGFSSAFLSISFRREKIVPECSDCLPSGKCASGCGGSAKKPRRKGAMNSTKHLWAGAFAAMVSRTFVAPLERLKLEYIVRGEKKHMVELIKRIATTQGIRGFWKGNLLNILRTAPFKAINFYAFDIYRKQLQRITANEEMKHIERFIAGAAAGITATVICLPLDTIRTRIIAHGGEQLGGVIGALVHMVQTEGFFSLHRGLLPSIISITPSSAVFYGVYDILKSAYLRSPEGLKRVEKLRQQGQQLTAFGQLELGPVRTLLHGAISGACAEAVTYPCEVLRRQLQMQVKTNRLSAPMTFVNIFQQRGVLGLYAGLLPSLLQVLPSAAISYFIYEFTKIVLEVE